MNNTYQGRMITRIDVVRNKERKGIGDLGIEASRASPFRAYFARTRLYVSTDDTWKTWKTWKTSPLSCTFITDAFRHKRWYTVIDRSFAEYIPVTGKREVEEEKQKKKTNVERPNWSRARKESRSHSQPRRVASGAEGTAPRESSSFVFSAQSIQEPNLACRRIYATTELPTSLAERDRKRDGGPRQRAEVHRYVARARIT